jgi:hypothetical protein
MLEQDDSALNLRQKTGTGIKMACRRRRPCVSVTPFAIASFESFSVSAEIARCFFHFRI